MSGDDALFADLPGDGTTGKDPLGLGLRFWAAAPGVVARFEPQPGQMGPPGYLHGGLAATVLDETMATLGWVLDDTPCVTAKLEIRYRQGIRIDGGPVRVEAWRDRPEPRRTQRVKGRILLADGRVAVEAEGLFVQVRDAAGEDAAAGDGRPA